MAATCAVQQIERSPPNRRLRKCRAIAECYLIDRRNVSVDVIVGIESTRTTTIRAIQHTGTGGPVLRTAEILKKSMSGYCFFTTMS